MKKWRIYLLTFSDNFHLFPHFHYADWRLKISTTTSLLYLWLHTDQLEILNNNAALRRRDATQKWKLEIKIELLNFAGAAVIVIANDDNDLRFFLWHCHLFKKKKTAPTIKHFGWKLFNILRFFSFFFILCFFFFYNNKLKIIKVARKFNRKFIYFYDWRCCSNSNSNSNSQQ